MIRLLQGDCLTMLKEVAPASVDLVLCDPPYSSGGTHAGDRKASTTAKYTDRDYDGAAKLPAFSGDSMDQRSFTAFMRWVCSELRQKTREGGILEIFVDWRNLPAMTDAVQMAGWVWRGVLVWDKGVSRNQPGRFRNDCEFVVWCSNGDLPIDWKAAKGSKAMPGVYHVPGVPPKQRVHQTEKPVELLRALIQICPRGGDRDRLFHGIRQHWRRLRAGGPELHRHRAGRPVFRDSFQAHPGGPGRDSGRLLESLRTLQKDLCYTGIVKF